MTHFSQRKSLPRLASGQQSDENSYQKILKIANLMRLELTPKKLLSKLLHIMHAEERSVSFQ